MKKFALSLFVLSATLVGFAQTSVRAKETKARVDAIKSAIPYPRFNLGDTLYIAFIKDPETATNRVRHQDVDVREIRVVNLMLVSSSFGYKYAEGLYLEDALDEFPPRWKYQFYDTSNPNPRYGDRSAFFDEDRFFSSPAEAEASIVNFAE